MIKFSQMLSEGRDAPLYRGMPIPLLMYALAEDKMVARQIHTIEFNQTGIDKRADWNAGKYQAKGISTTRKFLFARDWAIDGSGLNNACVVQFDQHLLAQTNRIIPYNYYTMAGIFPGSTKIQGRARFNDVLGRRKDGDHTSPTAGEYEEFVIGDIKRLDIKIAKIYAFTWDGYEKFMDTPMETDPRIVLWERGMKV